MAVPVSEWQEFVQYVESLPAEKTMMHSLDVELDNGEEQSIDKIPAEIVDWDEVNGEPCKAEAIPDSFPSIQEEFSYSGRLSDWAYRRAEAGYGE